MHEETIMMMHASSYSTSKNCHPKVAITFYISGITHTLNIYDYIGVRIKVITNQVQK